MQWKNWGGVPRQKHTEHACRIDSTIKDATRGRSSHDYRRKSIDRLKPGRLRTLSFHNPANYAE